MSKVIPPTTCGPRTSDDTRELRQLRWENASLKAQLEAVTDMLWTMGATRYVELTNPDRAKILREREEG